MNEKAVCEVMLLAYKQLERMCDKVEERTWRVALGSIHNDVREVAERIIRLNNEKIAYCNIKAIVDEAVKSTGKNAEIKGYYIDGLPYTKIMEREQITERTFYYRLHKQKERLCQFIMDNYDAEYLSGTIMDSKWLRDRYRQTINADKPKIKP